MLVRPDHPLAGPKGTVLEHRMVVYDAGIDPTGYDVHHKNARDAAHKAINDAQDAMRNELASV